MNLNKPVTGIWRISIAIFMLVVLLSIGVIGYWTYTNQGFSMRLIRTKSGLLAYSGMKKSTNEANVNCPLTVSVSQSFEINCILHLNPNSKKILLVWGDSHAQSWLPLFEAIAHENNLQLYVLAHHGCPPILGVRRSDGLTALPCLSTHSMDLIIEDIIRLHPQAVILAARWSLYSEGWIKEGRLQEASHFLTTDETGLATLATSRQALGPQISATINKLTQAGIKVLVIKNPPILHFEVFNPRKNQEQIRVSKSEHQQQNQFIEQIFSSLPQAYFFDPIEKLCPDTQIQCIIEQDGKILYNDDNHLNIDGAYWFKEDIQRKIQAMQVLP